MIHFDNRDSTIFSSRGTLFQMVQELAGIGGDVGFIKHELNYQLNVPVTNDVVSCVNLNYLLYFSNQFEGFHLIFLDQGYSRILPRWFYEATERRETDLHLRSLFLGWPAYYPWFRATWNWSTIG